MQNNAQTWKCITDVTSEWLRLEYTKALDECYINETGGVCGLESEIYLHAHTCVLKKQRKSHCDEKRNVAKRLAVKITGFLKECEARWSICKDRNTWKNSSRQNWHFCDLIFFNGRNKHLSVLLKAYDNQTVVITLKVTLKT